MSNRQMMKKHRFILSVAVIVLFTFFFMVSSQNKMEPETVSSKGSADEIAKLLNRLK